MSASSADPRRVRSERLGLLAEAVAAMSLRLRGYRIIGRRVRTPHGEIDVIGVRGRRIAFIEVKYRPTLEAGEAALEAASVDRLTNAAEHWLARHPRYQDHDLGFDAMIVLPWRLPRYLPDALQPVGTNARADR